MKIKTKKLTNKLIKDENMNFTTTINNKKYIDCNNMTKWLYLSTILSNKETEGYFYEYIPDEAYDDTSFDDVETEFYNWLLNIIYLKIDSLDPVTATKLTPEAQKLLDEAENCYLQGWFKLFENNRFFFIH